MSASDTRNDFASHNRQDASVRPAPEELRLQYARAARIYAVITVFVALFGAVYEFFSFGVYSVFMLYAFAVPLLMGVVPSVFLSCSKTPPVLREAGRRLWHDAIGVLTLGSLFTGVVRIYGTRSEWSYVYAFAGILLTVLAIVMRKAPES